MLLQNMASKQEMEEKVTERVATFKCRFEKGKEALSGFKRNARGKFFGKYAGGAWCSGYNILPVLEWFQV